MVQWFRLQVRPEHAVLLSIPNGDQRDAWVQDRLLEEGLLPGAPDLIIALPAARLLWVEVKTDKNEIWGIERTYLSPVQKNVHGLLRALGHEPVVCRSVEELADLLEQHGVPFGVRPITPLLAGRVGG